MSMTHFPGESGLNPIIFLTFDESVQFGCDTLCGTPSLTKLACGRNPTDLDSTAPRCFPIEQWCLEGFEVELANFGEKLPNQRIDATTEFKGLVMMSAKDLEMGSTDFAVESTGDRADNNYYDCYNNNTASDYDHYNEETYNNNNINHNDYNNNDSYDNNYNYNKKTYYNDNHPCHNNYNKKAYYNNTYNNNHNDASNNDKEHLCHSRACTKSLCQRFQGKASKLQVHRLFRW
ncbi:unnamed protein product [Bursaphelenchus xylophilus]|uniref:(pine wood nematode) hypothetical protein n=1 Tax=Bursaphelenchus xylophilus TaxID=6326 RepID=A0A1I7SRX6_BURXY|nr:unnamed protein product [Bursaphelenchus xylophilus]CAG9101741.1 unnamed protein product [Bursaphelenchus xylophilus]